LSKDERFAVALFNFKDKTIRLFDNIDDQWPIKIVDFEMSLAASIFLRI